MKQILCLLAICAIAINYPYQRAYAASDTAGSAAQLAANEDTKDPNIRVKKLKAYLAKFDARFHSPLTDEVDHIVHEADTNKIDWRLIVAIAGVESTFCEFLPSDSHNCWGWGIPTGSTSGLAFTSFKEAISTITKGLRENYMNRGYKTIEQIGTVYAASPTWALKVLYFMNDIDSYTDVSSKSLELTL